MKYQILFSGKDAKNITNVLSAELAKKMVKINQECLEMQCLNLVSKTSRHFRLIIWPLCPCLGLNIMKTGVYLIKDRSTYNEDRSVLNKRQEH